MTEKFTLSLTEPSSPPPRDKCQMCTGQMPQHTEFHLTIRLLSVSTYPKYVPKEWFNFVKYKHLYIKSTIFELYVKISSLCLLVF